MKSFNVKIQEELNRRANELRKVVGGELHAMKIYVQMESQKEEERKKMKKLKKKKNCVGQLMLDAQKRVILMPSNREPLLDADLNSMPTGKEEIIDISCATCKFDSTRGTKSPCLECSDWYDKWEKVEGKVMCEGMALRKEDACRYWRLSKDGCESCKFYNK